MQRIKSSWAKQLACGRYCTKPGKSSQVTVIVGIHVDYANETLTASLLIGGSLITLANGLAQFDR